MNQNFFKTSYTAFLCQLGPSVLPYPFVFTFFGDFSGFTRFFELFGGVLGGYTGQDPPKIPPNDL